MRILTVDIGTGTQDIYLYDSSLDMENGFKLVVPSPTMMVHRMLKEATHKREAVMLSGVIMGGGPSAWAAEAHARAGLPIYALPEAAKTLNDDLDAVREMGIQVVSADEAARLPEGIQRIELRDFDFPAIRHSLAEFGVSLNDLAAVAVAVFDHGDSPPGYSDRQFRFDYLNDCIRQNNRLSAFAYRAEEIPLIMTRLRAVAVSAQASLDPVFENTPLIVMDTAPAAVLGATFDPNVAMRERVLIANLGNFHTLAFRLGPMGIEGVFEHHTGLLDQDKLDRLLLALADGSLQHMDVFGNHGHGALIYHSEPLPLFGEGRQGDFGVVVTGPRRSLMRTSSLKPYFAVPFGDMMIAGCFGLLAATADVLPELSDAIRGSLSRMDDSGMAPWDADI